MSKKKEGSTFFGGQADPMGACLDLRTVLCELHFLTAKKNMVERMHKLIFVIVCGLVAGAATVKSARLRTESGVTLYLNSGLKRSFASSMEAMKMGINLQTKVGHHPTLEECHRNCERSKGCGDGGVCLCGCCGEGDGCFCYSCGPLGMPIHDFSQHKADALDEPETCKGSKAMCGDSVFDQADREAKKMKEEALKKKIADAVEKERIQEEKGKRLAKEEEAEKKKNEQLKKRAAQVAKFTSAGEEGHKSELKELEKKNSDTLALLNTCKSNLENAKQELQMKEETAQQKQDEITQLEAEVKDLKERMAKREADSEKLKTDLKASVGKNNAQKVKDMKENGLKKN